MYDIQKIVENINEIHSGDTNQARIIFDPSKRIIVEAPAGCGKTKTMISKIAYLLATDSLETSKKILALTFSVNAAYKIKKDVFEQLPNMINCSSSDSMSFAGKIYVSNYHGFCRRILSIYGRFIAEGVDFLKLTPIDDYNEQDLYQEKGINLDIARNLSHFNQAIKENNHEFIDEHWMEYNNNVKQHVLTKGYITYNSIILLVLELFTVYSTLKQFYGCYFPILFIDEFQDTNYICWLLIKQLIANDTKVILMGDPLQRIYGFIGAVPDLMNVARQELNMVTFKMETNYRFKDNPEMLLLDKNIRLNAEKLNNEAILSDSNPDIIVNRTQQDEVIWICDEVTELINSNEKVVILVRAGATNRNTRLIIETFEERNIPFFYALFTDNDREYDMFHEVCTKILNETIGDKGFISPRILSSVLSRVSDSFRDKTPTIKSLIKLLDVFFTRVLADYSYLNRSDLLTFVRDTLENKGLKQSMDKIDESVILATVHAFKGLEYPYVIIADNEKDSFPSYLACCTYCNNKNKARCVKEHLNDNEFSFFEELSVFYVGFTRARKKVFFTLSKQRLTATGSVIVPGSCFLKLKGIGHKNLMNISS